MKGQPRGNVMSGRLVDTAGSDPARHQRRNTLPRRVQTALCGFNQVTDSPRSASIAAMPVAAVPEPTMPIRSIRRALVVRPAFRRRKARSAKN